eukprot:COSAG06_NODE_26068_length_622_cov_1.405354_1_plen_153_part_00
MRFHTNTRSIYPDRLGIKVQFTQTSSGQPTRQDKTRQESRFVLVFVSAPEKTSSSPITRPRGSRSPSPPMSFFGMGTGGIFFFGFSGGGGAFCAFSAAATSCQCKIRQDKTRQDKTRQDKTGSGVSASTIDFWVRFPSFQPYCAPSLACLGK